MDAPAVSAASSSSPPSRFTSALVAGACAGTAVDTLFFPIDTLKTRAQSAQGFFAAGGFTGVYRGLASAVVGSAPGASLFFTSYELAKHHLARVAPNSLGTDTGAPVLHMLSASTGEVAACLVRVPTEVVKQRAQTSSAASSASLDVARRVWAREGLRGFYRGFGSTVAREIPFTCLQFPLYERLKLILARRLPSRRVADLPATHAAACGSLAGGVAAGLTTPLDIARAEGPGALFRGVVPRVVWISAGGAVFLGVYEAVKGALAGNGDAREARERRD